LHSLILATIKKIPVDTSNRCFYGSYFLFVTEMKLAYEILMEIKDRSKCVAGDGQEERGILVIKQATICNKFNVESSISSHHQSPCSLSMADLKEKINVPLAIYQII
jgi:hypothetical protein